jgi:DNA-binding response OmpR family regulator
MTLRVLVVEPDSSLRQSICLYLSVEGYQCDAHPDLESLAPHVSADRFVLAVMSLAAARPGSGRIHQVVGDALPTLILAGPGRDDEALAALERWADDYMSWPFGMRELIARAHALVRRRRIADDHTAAGGRADAQATVHDGFLLDAARRRVQAGGRTLALTEKAFRLLQAVAQRPGVVFPRHVLSSALGAESRRGRRRVDALIMGIRRQLTAADSEWEIATVRGVGYQFRRKSSSVRPIRGAGRQSD